MADNWLLFSEVLPRLTPQEETWLRSQLQWVAVRKGKKVEREIKIDHRGYIRKDDAEWVGPRFQRDNEGYDPSWDSLGFEFQFCDDDDTPNGWGPPFVDLRRRRRRARARRLAGAEILEAISA